MASRRSHAPHKLTVDSIERKRCYHITLPSVSLAILALVVVLVMLVVVLVVLVVVLVMLVVMFVVLLFVVLIVLVAVLVMLVVVLVVLVGLRILVVDVVDVYVVTPFYRAIEVVSLLESLPLSGCEHSPQLPVAAFPSV